MADWGDVVARARGLGSQLLSPEQRRGVTLSPNLGALAAQLAATGTIASTHAASIGSTRELETAVRRRAGARLRILARWAGPRATHLMPLFDDEDRQSLRALVRGTVAGLPAETRVAVLVPTPALPLRALDQLSRVADLSEIGATLRVWQHPYAEAVAAEAQRQHPDPFRIEVALAQDFGTRATRTARHVDGAMRRFVQRAIDIENLWSALALCERGADVDPATLFVPGGVLLESTDLALAVSSRSEAVLTGALRSRLARTPLAGAVDTEGGDRETRVLDGLVAEFRAMSLRDPLGTGPIIHFVLRQRQEVRLLQRTMWRLELGAPSPTAVESIGVPS